MPFSLFKRETSDVRRTMPCPILAMRRHNNFLQSSSGIVLADDQHGRFWFA
jgi:hypothetical protein